MTEHEVEDVAAQIEAEEVAAQIEAELAHLQVSDVLLHTASTVASLAYRGLHEAGRDLDEVRLGIDGLRALVPLIEDSLPDELRRDFGAVLADLQFAYAEAIRR